MVSGRTGGIIMIVSIFLPWWTFFFTSTVGSAFIGVWLFGGLSVSSAPGVATQTESISEFAVTVILVISSGALGIVSTRDRRFSLAGGALGLLGALTFLVKLGDVSGGIAVGSVFFGAKSFAGVGSLFWFLSIGFWLAIISSIIMLVAKPTIREQPVREISKPPEEPTPVPAAEIAPPGTPAMEIQCCSNCGVRLEPGAKFCSECGKSVGKKRIKRKRVGKKRIKRKRKAKTTR